MFNRLIIVTLLLASSYLQSCNKNKLRSITLQREAGLRTPMITPAGEPFIVSLDTCPEPITVAIPKKDSIIEHIKRDGHLTNIVIHAPTSIPVHFYVPMQVYNTEKGLAMNGMYSCHEDQFGNLWFGTMGGGVTCYNGKTSTTFTGDMGLGNNTVGPITSDSMGNLWFSCQGGGLTKYDGRVLTTFTKKDGLLSDEVRGIVIEKNGDLLIATREGPCRFDGKRFYDLKGLPGFLGKEILMVCQDKQGHAWFGTKEAGVNQLIGNQFINYSVRQGLNDNEVICGFCDGKGQMWFGTRAYGLSRFDGEKFTVFKDLPGEPVHSIHDIKEDNEGNIWLGVFSQGSFRFDGQRFIAINENNSLIQKTVYAVTKDNLGNLWFGTTGSGAVCYSGDAFRFMTVDQGLPDNIIRGLMEDSNGNLWFGGSDGGPSMFDGKAFHNYSRPQGFLQNRTNRIFEDKEKAIWFCTSGGVYKLAGNILTAYTQVPGLAHNAVRCIMQDKKGNFWFGTERGLSKFDGRYFYNYQLEQGLANNNIRDIEMDDDGNLWMGTIGGGLIRYDGKTFLTLDTAQGLLNNYISNVTFDSKGNLWICTENGGVNILRKEMCKRLQHADQFSLNENIFESFTKKQGLSDNGCYALVEDHQGNIIIGTNLGITIVKGGISKNGSLSSQQLEYYNWKNGYHIKDVNTQAMLVDSKDIIWIGTGEKLIRLDYKAIRKNPNPPNLIIESMRINNEKLVWYNLLKTTPCWIKEDDVLKAIALEENIRFNRTLSTAERDSMRKRFGSIRFDSIARFHPVPINPTLPYQFNNVSFDFAAIEAVRPEQVRYRYMLEGYDKDWGPVTDQSFASFGNIYEGSYTFKVKAMSPDGVWSESVSFAFTILPPYWRSWWFRSLYITALATLVFFIVKWRIEVVRKNEQKKLAHEKQLLELEARALRAQMNPHFIFNCLNSIKALMQQHETERGVAYLTTFSKLIRTLFNNAEKRQISLYDEMETCRLYTQLEAMRLNGKLKCDFNIDANLDLKSIMVPALIIQPFIENAIWHGIVPKDGGAINISIKGSGETVICVVEDNGIGREMSKRNKSVTPVIHESKGVKLSQARLDLEKMINNNYASIEIVDKYTDDVATGTKVILTFNLN